MIIQLMRGVIEFQKELTDEISAIYDQLSQQGQHPDIFLLTCSDSRVMPELLTQAKPGALFTHRNVGNMIPHYAPLFDDHEQFASPPSEIAALEFAIKGLNVKNIIICGHSDCGAMKVLITPNPSLAWVNHWVYAQASSPGITVALEEDHADPELTARTKKNILVQLEKLKTYPMVQERLQKGDLALHGWYFDFQSKKLHIYEPTCKQFVDLKTALHYAISERKEKIVNTLVIDYLKMLPLPENASQYQARTTLLSKLQSESLGSIWDAIKLPITEALWKELVGLYPSVDDAQFKIVVDTAAEMKITPSDKKLILKALEPSKGYYDFCHNARTSWMGEAANQPSLPLAPPASDTPPGARLFGVT